MGSKNKRRFLNTQRKVNLPRSAVAMFALIVTLMLAYLWMDHRCTTYGEEIGVFERRNTALENECVREQAKFDAMKTAAQLDGLLLRQGLAMSYPQPWQVVRMDGGAKGSRAASNATAAHPGTVTSGGGTWTMNKPTPRRVN